MLSKLGCIVKENINIDTGQVTKKTRIILDCKKSLVPITGAEVCFKNALLPRVSDAVHTALRWLHSCDDIETVTLFIADVADAF